MAASLPIENSPPGIQTMPSGAGVGAGVLLGIVGAKSELAVSPAFVRLTAVPSDDAGVDRTFTNTKTPATTTTATSAAARRFCLPRRSAVKPGVRVFFMVWFSELEQDADFSPLPDAPKRFAAASQRTSCGSVSKIPCAFVHAFVEAG